MIRKREAPNASRTENSCLRLSALTSEGGLETFTPTIKQKKRRTTEQRTDQRGSNITEDCISQRDCSRAAIANSTQDTLCQLPADSAHVFQGCRDRDSLLQPRNCRNREARRIFSAEPMQRSARSRLARQEQKSESYAVTLPRSRNGWPLTRMVVFL